METYLRTKLSAQVSEVRTFKMETPENIRTSLEPANGIHGSGEGGQTDGSAQGYPKVPR